MKINMFKELLSISVILGIITCAFIQKIKINFKSSKYLPIFSFIINMVISILFCITFTKIKFPHSLWVGFFSFIEADSVYKTLEGKLLSYENIASRKKATISYKNIINPGDKDV